MDMFIMYCLLNRRIKEPLCDVNAMAEKKEDAAGLPRSDIDNSGDQYTSEDVPNQQTYDSKNCPRIPQPDHNTSPTFTPTQDIQLQHERYAERAIEPW